MCVDWNNLLSTFIGAFTGALGAYFCNIKQANDELKCNEKAKLLKLFYDINILAKVFVYHHENTVAMIHNLTNPDLKSYTPITLQDANFNIDEYGFLTKTHPKLYEILTYIRHDINYIYEQDNIITEFLCKEVPLETYLIKLKHIKISALKLLAKLCTGLSNINMLLNKEYECQNLIKEEIANSYIRIKKVIKRNLKEYQKIISNPKSKKKIDKEDLITIQVDSKYVNEILDTWILDFKLSKKQRVKIEEEISKEVGKRWEAPENDL